MNPEQNNNSNGKQKIHTKDFQSKCTNTSKPRAMSPKLEIKPTSTKTSKCPKQPPPSGMQQYHPRNTLNESHH
jgi:hypothetical protein